MPRLNLLPDDRLDLSVVFASVLDEGLDRSIEIVGHFTAIEGGVSLPLCMSLETVGLPKGAHIVDYTGGRDEIRYQEERGEVHSRKMSKV